MWIPRCFLECFTFIWGVGAKMIILRNVIRFGLEDKIFFALHVLCSLNDSTEQRLVLFTKGVRACIKSSSGSSEQPAGGGLSVSPLCGRFLPDVRVLGWALLGGVIIIPNIPAIC